MANLNTKAFGGLFFLLLVMAALLFFPAWTLDYRAGMGLPRRVRGVGACQYALPYEKRSEAPGAAGARGANCRKGDEPKDHPIHHGSRIYGDARFTRAWI